MAKLEAADTQVLGISIDSPAANAAYAKSIGVTFPLLSDMNRAALTSYGILKKYDVSGDQFQWAQRTSFVVDKQGVIQHIDIEDEAVNPNNALTMCTNLHKKESGTK
jgi:peroxiredoxin